METYYTCASDILYRIQILNIRLSVLLLALDEKAMLFNYSNHRLKKTAISSFVKTFFCSPHWFEVNNASSFLCHGIEF